MDISLTYIKPEFRNKGLFKKLNVRAEKYFGQFRDIKFLRICVLAENNMALNA